MRRPSRSIRPIGCARALLRRYAICLHARFPLVLLHNSRSVTQTPQQTRWPKKTKRPAGTQVRHAHLSTWHDPGSQHAACVCVSACTKQELSLVTRLSCPRPARPGICPGSGGVIWLLERIGKHGPSALPPPAPTCPCSKVQSATVSAAWQLHREVYTSRVSVGYMLTIKLKRMPPPPGQRLVGGFLEFLIQRWEVSPPPTGEMWQLSRFRAHGGGNVLLR